jgi:hypothetical protein
VRRKTTREGNRQALDKLFAMGIAALVLGAALLILPRLLENPVLMEAIGRGARTAGWCALVIGAALIVLHLVVRRMSRQDVPRQEPRWTTWAPSAWLHGGHTEFPVTDTPPLSRTSAHETAVTTNDRARDT